MRRVPSWTSALISADLLILETRHTLLGGEAVPIKNVGKGWKMMDSILTPKRSLQQSSEYFNYLYGTSWWVNLSANISKSAKLLFAWPRFCLQILCSISLNDPLYLSKSAKHQDLANVQMSRIGSCDQRCNSDIWFWHIEVCLGLVKNTHQHDKEMPHQSYTSSMSIFFFSPGIYLNFCTSVLQTLTITIRLSSK